MSEEDDSEKEHAPSQKRLADARKRGEVPRSADLSTAAGYAGLLLASTIWGGGILQGIGAALAPLLGQADRFGPLLTNAAHAPVGGLMVAIVLSVLPLFALPAVGALAAILVQRAFVVAPEKLVWKLSRLSPLSNAKQKFGREGLFEFGKSMAKMLLFSGVLGVFLLSRAPDILQSHILTPALSTELMLCLFLEFLFLVVVISTVIGGVDYLWQHAQHLRRNRMSRKDLLDEMKESEGDPQTKQQRRQRGQEIATNRMLQDVAKADVIVVNPTHYAIALKWNRTARGAPICVAKGTDETAARIREKAALAGVPVHSDPPTARALHATVKVGQPVLPEHYRAVAAAIRFSESMRKRGKRPKS